MVHNIFLNRIIVIAHRQSLLARCHKRGTHTVLKRKNKYEAQEEHKKYVCTYVCVQYTITRVHGTGHLPLMISQQQ